MTERLYYSDAYLSRFDAAVIDTADDGRRVYLDRTAFYPASGGQPFDLGTLGGVRVSDVIDEEERIAHILDAPLAPGAVEGVVDWPRRFDHMQQHTGQHLLSAVLVELFNAQTLSFHLGGESATIELGIPSLDAAQLERAEAYANELVEANRSVTVSFEDAAQAAGLRKASEREGTLRIVSIEGLDRSACGGTHVRATGEIGPILLRRVEKIRGNARLEFLCGARAVRRARADYDALSRVARVFSCALDDAPAMVAAQQERVLEADRARRKLAAELAQLQGKELYAATAPGDDGLRRHVRRIARGPLEEELRVLAQSYTAGSKAVFLAASADPPSLLLAASADSGIHAGNVVKAAVTAAGGRGGGSATVAQGSVPSPEALEAVLARIARQ